LAKPDRVSRAPRRSRRIALLLGVAAAAAVLAVVITMKRRGLSVPPVPEIARQTKTGRKVIFVGLDGADWELLDRYTASGAMPNLKALIDGGTGGVLLSGHPMISPLVWTTMMTGVSPVDHGILDFTRYHPSSGREEPITSDERRAPAVWNMASWGGKRVAVLGMWATYPAEPVSGLVVSDRVLPFLFAEARVGAGLVYPPGRISSVLEARRRAQDHFGIEQIRAYVPDATPQELDRPESSRSAWDHPVSALRRVLVETHLVHALAMEALRRDEPDLTIAYFEGTDAIAHVFAPFAPPRRPQVDGAEYERFHRAPELYFRLVDEMLGEYRRLALASNAVLMLASDHGFRWGEARPHGASGPAHARAAEWHRREGIYLLWGSGITPEPGHRGRGRVDQVAATLLELLGLPPGPKGPPLRGVARSEGTAIDYAAFYRPVAAQDPADTDAGEEAIEKLRALGYVTGGKGAAPRLAGSTRTAGSHANECLILRLSGRAEPAREAAERALVLDPRHAAAHWCLSDVLLGDPRQPERSDELLVRAYALGLPDGIRHVAARVASYQRSGDASRGARLLATASEALPQDGEIWQIRGRYAVDRAECRTALGHYAKAAATSPTEPSAQAGLGLAKLCLGDEAGAAEHLQGTGSSLAEARLILAHGALTRGDLARAEREARRVHGDLASELAATVILAQVELSRSRLQEALSLLDDARRRRLAPGGAPVPSLELFRGDVLARLGRAADAETAFREEIRSFPRNGAAYVRLAYVLSLVRRPRAEIRALLDEMYAAQPTREVAAVAARTAASLGDAEAAEAWRRRAATPGAALEAEP
jgi:tetratricopeptide (TPR) repeat protein